MAMKKWAWLILYVVTVKDLGLKCIDFQGQDNKAHTKCEQVVRYHLNGFPDCESSHAQDCDYMYARASSLNNPSERLDKENAELKKVTDEFYKGDAAFLKHMDCVNACEDQK